MSLLFFEKSACIYHKHVIQCFTDKKNSKSEMTERQKNEELRGFSS